MTKAGFVAIVGRPNVGKSTLVNAMVGQKVAIVSSKPQTTRRSIRGVVSSGNCQIVLVDLPGVQRPRDELTQRMQKRVEFELEEADVILFVVNGHEGVGGPGDKFICNALSNTKTPVVIAVNKVDRLSKSETIVALQSAADLKLHSEIFPVAALTGDGVVTLVDYLAALLPEGPFYFPVEDRTDLPTAIRIAELVREQVLQRTREEVPHAVEVKVEEVTPREKMFYISAHILVEAESQKGIIIGTQGRMIKAIGTAARQEIEQVLNQKVHLDLSVRVRRKWRTDPTQLDRLGI